MEDKKQFFVLSEVRLSAFRILKAQTVVMLTQEEVVPLLAARLVVPLFSAIREGLYPPKQKENIVHEVIKNAVDQVHSVVDSHTLPPQTPSNSQPSPIVQNLKAATKQHNTKSLAFENELRKKIQAKKRAVQS